MFNDFGDSSVDLFVVCWVLVEEKAAFVAKVKEVIYNTLNKNKIEIPFPQQDIYVRHLEMPTQKQKEDKADSQPIEQIESALEPLSVDAPSTSKKRGRPKKSVKMAKEE